VFFVLFGIKLGKFQVGTPNRRWDLETQLRF
jgi:hypothetical protein